MDRDSSLDNAKGILIFLVVFGHLIEPMTSTNNAALIVWQCIYVFHMPTFVFISGFLFRPSANYSLRNEAQKLITPLIVFDVLYELLHVVLFKKPSSYLGMIAPYWILWFLLSLFLWKLLFAYFHAVRGILEIAIMTALLSGLVPIVGYAFSLSRAIYFFPFFIIGNQFSKNAFLSKHLVFNRRRALFSVAYLVIILILIPFVKMENGLLWGSVCYSNMGLGAIEGLIKRAILMIASMTSTIAFLTLTPRCRCFFTSIGKKSLYIFLCHGVVIRFIDSLSMYTTAADHPYVYLLLSAVATMTILVLFSEKHFTNALDNLLLTINKTIFKKASTPREAK